MDHGSKGTLIQPRRRRSICSLKRGAAFKPVDERRTRHPQAAPPCAQSYESPPIRRFLYDTGKSLFVWDCVVGLRGLELPTNRLSGARSEHRAMGPLLGTDWWAGRTRTSNQTTAGWGDQWAGGFECCSSALGTVARHQRRHSAFGLSIVEGRR
jgi:hypothetical protein